MSLFHVAFADSIFTQPLDFNVWNLLNESLKSTTKGKKTQKFLLRKLNGMEKFIDRDEKVFFSFANIWSHFFRDLFSV